MSKVAIIFAPHPDDLEFGCSYYVMSLLEQGYQIIQVSMTDGAFGTPNSEFKGKRIAKIRAKELDRATHVFENSFNTKIEIIRLGYTDGYLPFTSVTRDKIIGIIQKYNPDKVFAPDPWYSQDYHPDHINTGRLVLLALNKIGPTLRTPIPLILFYTYAPNRYIMVKAKYFKVLSDALSKHQSQLSPFGLKLVLKLIKFLFLGKNFLKFQKYAKGYRNQEFNHKNEPIFPPNFENNSLIHQIKYHLFHFPVLKAYEKLHNISPEELGIEIKK